MEKPDYKKELKAYYKPSVKKVECVVVPKMNYLMIDGSGDPGTSRNFQSAIEALYPLTYTLKFMIKRNAGVDYGVMPLEGLWWADDMSSFTEGNREDWKWTLMIMQPPHVSEKLVKEAVKEVRERKNPASLSKVRFQSFNEGRAAQIMHIGPFAEEGPAVEKVHSFIENSGSQLRGKHHEIYLSDIRRTAPEKLKTVIRQPMT